MRTRFQQSRRGGMHPALVAVMGCTTLLLAGCGDGGVLSRPASTTTVVTVVEDPAVTSTTTGITGHETATPAAAGTQHEEPSAAFPSFRAGSNTSDAFARNVYQAFLEQFAATGSHQATVTATSPVTGQTYSMVCDGFEIVHCSGGNNATVYIYYKDPPGSGGGIVSDRDSAAVVMTLTGTIRFMSGEAFAAEYPYLNANPVIPGDTVAFLQLDTPTAITGINSGAPLTKSTKTTDMVRLDYTSGLGNEVNRYANRDGEHVTMTFTSDQCTWPSDTAPPVGKPGCK